MRSEKDRSALVVRAHAQLAEGKAAEARASFLKAERAGARSLDLYLGLATSATLLNILGEAEVWWRRAVRRFPDNAECLHGLGNAEYRLGRPHTALQSIRRALEIDPEAQGARVSLAVCYLAAGFPALALQEAERVLLREPDNIDMRLTRTSALIKMGRARESLGDLAWLYDRGAKLGEVALLECEVNRAQGDFEAALMLAAELAEAFPTLPAPLNSFRTIFDDFVASVPGARVNEFLMGLGLQKYGVEAAAKGKRQRRPRKLPTTDVIIPVHDALDDLKACIYNLEAHRSPCLGQIILVNDCSSASTRAWLRKLERSRPGIRVLHTRKQSGFSRTLALGIAHSEAQRFVALNSDCVVSEGWLERLAAAMQPQGRVAMVGPLSNNAGWQTLGQVLDETGNYAGEPLPTTSEIDRIQKRLELIKVFDAPATSLIHGFCVLVDRRIYDRLGGLDVDLFPKGYGEFQDLSLRALDAGFELRVADDCFIGHARGGSISAVERSELSRGGRKRLYARYTALRYLAAECSASSNPAVSLTRQRFKILEKYCPGALTRWDSRARLTILGDLDADFARKRVCVFVSFSPDGRLLPYTLHYLSQLRAQGFHTILILNEVGQHRLPPEALDLARVVILRDNKGFDFGAWRDAVARFPGVWDADVLLFTNDSILGPFDGFDRLIGRIEETSAEVFFLTESEFAMPHFQSFFWGLKGAGLRNPVVRAFLNSVLDMADKAGTIFLYEVFFRRVCEGLAGLAALCLFPLTQHTDLASDIRWSVNPTHHFWRELLRAGFPFLKIDFCRKNLTGPNAAAWQTEIAAVGGDEKLARLHVEAVQVQRLAG